MPEGYRPKRSATAFYGRSQRRMRDSNPRCSFPQSRFQICRLQPLGQSSRSPQITAPGGQWSMLVGPTRANRPAARPTLGCPYRNEGTLHLLVSSFPAEARRIPNQVCRPATQRVRSPIRQLSNPAACQDRFADRCPHSPLSSRWPLPTTWQQGCWKTPPAARPSRRSK